MTETDPGFAHPVTSLALVGDSIHLSVRIYSHGRLILCSTLTWPSLFLGYLVTLFKLQIR